MSKTDTTAALIGQSETATNRVAKLDSFVRWLALGST